MGAEGGSTTASIQNHLNQLRADVTESEAVRGLLERSAARLSMLCGNMLRRRYPRLTYPPLNLSTDELLSAVVERLIKAMREARPSDVRQFFALAGQHMRWELNDLARRLDREEFGKLINEDLVPTSEPSDSQLSDLCKKLFEEIDALPSEQREVFELVRLQGLSIAEVAPVLGVTEVTVRRRLNRALSGLTALFDGKSPSN